MAHKSDPHTLTGRQPRPVRWWRLAAEAALLMALAAAASSARPGDKLPERVEGMTVSASERIGSAPYSLRRPRAPARIESVAVDTADLQRALSANGATPRPGVPRQIGVARDVSQLGTAAEMAKRLHWQRTAEGGTVAAVGIASRSALGMRIGVRVFRLPASAKLRFYASGSSAAHEVSGESVLSTLQRNRDSGDSDDEASTFWSPLIESDDVTLEVELPPGVGPAAMAIAVPRVSHVFASPLAAVPGASASCELDATCYGDWRPESDATAKMAFVWAGGSYVCSGTLVNDAASSGTPYFLSANHCIPNQSAASTIQTYWFYRSVSCNSAAYNPAYQTRIGGASLLYSSTGTDTAFMQLRDLPPAGARYAAWTTSGVSLGSPLAGLHHPEGDLQKITFGILWGFAKCTGLVGGVFQCDVATPVTGEYLAIAYTSGIHEPGSSGSGLFATIDGKHYLIGQMYGTDSSCINPGGLGFAGHFVRRAAAACVKAQFGRHRQPEHAHADAHAERAARGDADRRDRAAFGSRLPVQTLRRLRGRAERRHVAGDADLARHAGAERGAVRRQCPLQVGRIHRDGFDSRRRPRATQAVGRVFDALFRRRGHVLDPLQQILAGAGRRGGCGQCHQQCRLGGQGPPTDRPRVAPDQSLWIRLACHPCVIRSAANQRILFECTDAPGSWGARKGRPRGALPCSHRAATCGRSSPCRIPSTRPPAHLPSAVRSRR